MPGQREVEVNPVLDCVQAALVQRLDLRPSALRVGQVFRRTVSPQRLGPTKQDRGLLQPAGLRGRGRVGQPPVELQHIQFVGVRHQPVPARIAHQPVDPFRIQQRAQVRHIHLQRAGPAGRDVGTPDRLAQGIDRDRSVAPQRQQRQHRPLLGATQRDRPAVHAGGQPAQHSDLQRHPSPTVASRPTSLARTIQLRRCPKGQFEPA